MILQRLESRYSKVLPGWSHVAIIGGGPSFDLEQAEMLRVAHADGLRVIAINDAYLWAPWADLLYASDAHWYTWHRNGIAKPVLKLSAAEVRERYAAFAQPKCSIQQDAEKLIPDDVHVLRNRDFPCHGHGISLDPEMIVTGRNSTFAALNIAILAGAKSIILCGVDGGPDKQGKVHFHGNHPNPIPDAFWGEMRRAFSAAEGEIEAAGVSITNCSPGSAIDSFPKMTLADALAGIGDQEIDAIPEAMPVHGTASGTARFTSSFDRVPLDA